jgi:hypothetical protein
MTKSTSQAGNRADHGDQFRELLDLLGIDAHERIAICSQPVGGKFNGNTVPVNRSDSEKLALSTPYVEKRDVWFGVNPVALPSGYLGRGTDDHVTRAVALFADIDIKATGVDNIDTADTVARAISEALGQLPAAVVFSGHGGHVYWTLDPEDWTLDTAAKRKAAMAVYARFHRLCEDIAGKHGGSVDKVSQLSRILRVPGTFNRKDPGDPILADLRVQPYGASGPLSFREVFEALDSYGVPELPEDREHPGEAVCAPEEWTFGEQTTAYLGTMIDRWRTDTPRSGVNRHSWLVSQSVRLACAHRLGRITADDHDKAAQVLAARFTELLETYGDPRKPTPGEVAGALAWGAQRAASMSDDRAGEEIGGGDLSPEVIDLTNYGDTAAEPTPEQRVDGVKAAKANLAAVMTRNIDLFSGTEVLTKLAAFAEARKVGRWTLVGGVMVRTVAALHPSVVLPATIGGEVSLNLLLAQCGVPGSGKGASDNAVSDATVMMFDNYTAPRLPLLPIGTGEGINRAYAHCVPVPGERRSETVFHSRHALFSIRDIVTLEKLADRAGATIIGELLKAYMGEELGFTNAGRETNVVLPQHSYRLGLLMGVQPDRASILLDAVARGNGLTHRILALPVTDLRQRSGRPETGTPVTLKLPGDLHRDPFSDDMTLLPLDVPIAIAEALIEGQNAKNLDVFGESDNTPLSGHRGLSRLKLASTLGLMHGSTSAGGGFWEMAERFTEVSDAMMAAMVAASQHSEAIVAGEQGRRDGHRRTAADDTIRMLAVDRVRERVLTVLRQQTDWMPHSGLANAVSRPQRGYLADALPGLLRDGRIESESGEYSGKTVVRYRIAAAAA